MSSFWPRFERTLVFSLAILFGTVLHSQDVAPAGGPLRTSPNHRVHFRIVFHPAPSAPKPVESGIAEFRGSSASCTVTFTLRGAVTPSCLSLSNVSTKTLPDGSLEAVASIGFSPKAFSKSQTLHLFIASGVNAPSVQAASYLISTADSSPLNITVSGVTNTQATLTFTPPDPAAGCTVAVTSAVAKDGTADFSQLVTDVDYNIFPGADQAVPFDPSTPAPDRGVQNPDGTRTIVIGKRTSEYSPLTFKRHSRALQANTLHQAWIGCGASSGIVNFTTANMMPGVTYTDPIPSDPNAPGQYAYPTMSWTNRSDSAIDPHTGLKITHVSLPNDSTYNASTGLSSGVFAAPIPAFPAVSLPATSIFVPANLGSQIPGWYHPILDGNQPSWYPSDLVLSALSPGAFNFSCPSCSNTPITVCLTADGVNCAVDINMASDPNASAGAAALGVSFSCSGLCSFPASDARWNDFTPALKSWHPQYDPNLDLTVSPNFQIDSIKVRTAPVTCDGSVNIQRTGNQGAPFSTVWSAGTPLLIGATRYFVKTVVDESNLILSSPCPSSNSSLTLTANTFGILIKSPVPISGISPISWRANMHIGQYAWDAAGSIDTSTNCSTRPITVNGVAGWHCSIGFMAYWIAADGSRALPMGYLKLSANPQWGSDPYCVGSYWDNRDGNKVYCATYAAQNNDFVLVAMTFQGDHSGLDSATYNIPDLGGYSSLPLCSTTVTNNCWTMNALTAPGSTTPLTFLNAIRSTIPDVYNHSGIAAAFAAGQMSLLNFSRIGDDYITFTLVAAQNSMGITGILQLSNPRNSISVKAVRTSWAGDPSLPVPSDGGPRWGVFHNNSSAPWGGTKITFGSDMFRGGAVTGFGPYYSNLVASSSAPCPAGVSGTCLSLTLDGQPGDPDPAPLEPSNDLKTAKPGFGYLQDLAPGDYLCAPKDNLYYLCSSYIGDQYEDLKILSVTPLDTGSGLKIVALRNLGGTPSFDWTPGQQFYTIPTDCRFENYNCSGAGTIFDFNLGTFETIDIGGCCHEFQNSDPSHNQFAYVSAVAQYPTAPYCSPQPSGQLDCYAVTTGTADFTKPIGPQAANFKSVILPTSPTFSGLSGFGSPNPVDSHPGGFQIPFAPDQEKTWFVDGRPFLGIVDVPLPSPPAPVSGFHSVYAYGAADNISASVDAYKKLPPISYCGLQILHEVTRIGDDTPYSYCFAVSGGDCLPASKPGQSFLSCPSVSPYNRPYSCVYPGIAVSTPESRDICLTAGSQYAMNLTQVGFATQNNGVFQPLHDDQLTRSGRVLTNGFARYRTIDVFWNPKTTPDGKVLLFRASYLNGYSTQVLMSPLPPFPDLTQDTIDRTNFVPTPATLQAPDGTASVKVRFGYNPSFYCVARPEACEARADLDPSPAATPFFFASEANPPGIDCSAGCPASINLPGISQRVLYYQAVYTDPSGIQTTGPLQVAVVP